MPALIEDHDGAPLPDALQFESPLWNAVYDLVKETGTNAHTTVLRTDAAMIALAPILFPDGNL